MFVRVHHVALAVHSLEDALQFYRDVLGLPVGKRATVADQGVEAALLPMDEGEIELLEPVDPAGGVARFLERRGEGLHHLCLETPDVSSALARAKSANLPLIDQTPRPGLAGMIAFLHPKASHGVLVELAQPLTPKAHPKFPSGGLDASGISTVYVAVKDLAAAATTYCQNFGGRVGAVQDDVRLGGMALPIAVGRSQITLLGSSDPTLPVAQFLAERGEGLFGVCLEVADLETSVRHLQRAGIATEVRRVDPLGPLACVDPGRAHGAKLFLRHSAVVGQP